MANLIIRKSDTENISIPLTTEKPIARSLAIFKDGQIYYNPLVHSGDDDLDSGVRVCIDGDNYALSTSIYNPALCMSTSNIWTPSGEPTVHQRGYLELNGSSYLGRIKTFSLTKASYLSFNCDIRVTALRGITQCIFVVYVNTSTFISLFINASNKLAISVNGTAIKTASATLTENRAVTAGLWHQSGAFDLYYSGDYLGTVAKNMTSGTYTARIGANAGGENRFIGKISDVIIVTPYLTLIGKYMRFGN